jgi:predicted acetyltransferase
MQTHKFVWDAPEDDNLWSQLCHNEMETSVATHLQGRVVEVGAALTAWRPIAAMRGTLVLGIEDLYAPWNTGSWSVSYEEGSVAAHLSHDEAQVTMDIQAFSQAFMGVLTVAALRKQERLTVHDESGFRALCDLLSGPLMWTDGNF